MLTNESTLAIGGVDTAEKWPSEVWRRYLTTYHTPLGHRYRADHAEEARVVVEPRLEQLREARCTEGGPIRVHLS